MDQTAEEILEHCHVGCSPTFYAIFYSIMISLLLTWLKTSSMLAKVLLLNDGNKDQVFKHKLNLIIFI